MADIGNYETMLRYIAELENTSIKKVVTLDKKPKFGGSDVYAYKDGIKYNNPRRKYLKGGIEVLETDSNQFPIDTVFDKWEVHIRKDLKEFKTVPIFVCKVKICEGNGWYSNGHQYRVNDRLFEF